MAASREVLHMDGWRGGLNISRPSQQLRPDETPDCLNVAFDDKGGITSRRGYKTVGLSDESLDGALLLYPTAQRVFLMSATGKLGLYTGAEYVETADELTDQVEQRPVATQYDGIVYVNKCWETDTLVTRRIDANNVMTTLGTAWNNDYTQPTTGNMPAGRVLATHNGHVFVADTTEGPTRYPSRVRFSHLGQPESFAQNDYFDLDPEDDRDGITAMMAVENQLLIFKRSSVYAVGGWDRDSFYQRKVSPSAGVCADTGAASSSGIAYWASNDGNVFGYNGERPIPIGDNISALWRDGEVDCSARAMAVWARGHLYCSFDVKSNTNGMYVYSPAGHGRAGMWTRHDFKPSSMLYWQRGGGQDELLFTLAGQPWLFDFMDESQFIDRIGEETFRINGYLRTHWIDAGETATRKRWRRPRITAGATQPSNIRIRVYRNFDEDNFTKTLTLQAGAGLPEHLSWDVDDWDETEWSGADRDYVFRRLSSLGSAYAVQLRISSDDNPERWWVDSIAFPFRRRSIR